MQYKVEIKLKMDRQKSPACLDIISITSHKKWIDNCLHVLSIDSQIKLDPCTDESLDSYQLREPQKRHLQVTVIL